MPTFNWVGKDKGGADKAGSISAANAEDAKAKLKDKGITVSRLRRKIAPPGGGKLDLRRYLAFLQPGVPTKSLVVFTRQFATMIDAGLPLVQALELLASQEPHKTFRAVISRVKEEVEAGSTFADALKSHPKVFDDLYVNLVAAGELGGVLDTILNRLASYIEKSMKLVAKVKGAMTYPIGMVIVAVLVIIVMLWKVIPVFQKMFSGFGGSALPGPTQFVVDLSAFVQHNFLWIALTIGGLVVGWKTFYGSQRGREIFDALILKMPFFGPLVRKTAVAKFTRTMGTMLASGVPILDALTVVSRSAGNKTIQHALELVREKISEGRTMAEPLAETKIFPHMVVQMIAVGESTGALDTMLTKIADFYDDEVDAAVSGLTSMLEPLMMVVLGGVLGGMMIAMYMPIFTMAGNIKG
ncbi:MAG: type II secretion system F family protein [Myxococcota bacterium]|jgi:type IV pilus assembly protein PilC|nr:type II secretion system F family protein [Myxococcota bacterium]